MNCDRSRLSDSCENPINIARESLIFDTTKKQKQIFFPSFLDTQRKFYKLPVHNEEIKKI